MRDDASISETCPLEESASHQLEYVLKIMRVAVENSSSGYNLISEIRISDGIGFLG